MPCLVLLSLICYQYTLGGFAMANLKSLSFFSLSLALLAASPFALCDEEKNLPPSDTIFYESDLWRHDANKEWVFTHLILSAVRHPNRRKIDSLNVSDNIKNSLETVRSTFNTEDTQILVQTGSIVDLVYAYSWENMGLSGYAFSGLWAISNQLGRLSGYFEKKIPFYKQHKHSILRTAVGIGAVTAAGLGLTRLCKAPPVSVTVSPQTPDQTPALAPATQTITPTPAPSPAAAPEGNFLTRKVKNMATNTAAAATTIGTAVTAHPYILAALAGGYAVYEICVTVSNKYYDVPTSLEYYTDRLTGGDGSAQSRTYTNWIYGFAEEGADEHYNKYVDMDLYNRMLRQFLVYNKRMNTLQFGAIPFHAEYALDEINRSSELTPSAYTSRLPDYFDRMGDDYANSRTKHRNGVAEAVNKVVDLANPANSCGKYELFNDEIFSDNPTPLYLFSICSAGETFAYVKLPWLPYARLKKSEIVGFVQELMEYTGGTRLVIFTEG